MTCTSVRPYATVRSTLAYEGVRKRQLEDIHWLVAKLEAEAQLYITYISGEAGEVHEETVVAWIEWLPTLFSQTDITSRLHYCVRHIAEFLLLIVACILINIATF